MQIFDASSMIYAWDNYPIEQFPGLWEWVAIQIEIRNLVISSAAFEEVSHKAPECCSWLKDNDISRLEVTNAILQDPDLGLTSQSTFRGSAQSPRVENA